MTVLFACRQIKMQSPGREIEEIDLYDYILSWKKAWNTGEKRAALARAIRSLVLLGWMKIRISESLVDEEIEEAA
jgi:hypothetical protein